MELVTAGIGHIVNEWPAPKYVLQFIGRMTQHEQSNQVMNCATVVME